MIEKARYINPFTDFGFKKLFGEEPNKDLLLDFLNEILKNEQGEIKSLTYLKNEQTGRSSDDRRAIFDIFCETEDGEQFIVEIQKSKQKWFKDRSVYYSTFPIQKQAQKNNWDFKLNPVYLIAILDFTFDDSNSSEFYRHNVKLINENTGEVFYKKLTYIFLEMPKFNKDLDELESKYEKWLYVLKNLPRLENIPIKLKEKIFEKVFETAELSQLTRDEWEEYEDSLKVYRDLKNTLDYSREIGYEKGKMQGKMDEKIKITKNLLKTGLDLNQIAVATGLTLEEIKKLENE